ncbi:MULTISPECIES: hypothetical protein [unclassified Dyella]|jgi:hypothetical protein|uniref:hypothetical protein n=1 Tax=unclassified Dyella TaxID=2634549 RepID=UPI003F92BA76
MSNASAQEFTVRNYLVRIYADQMLMPDGDGWVGAWIIYRLPRSPWDDPIRFGDTELVASQAIAVSMAKDIASIVAAAL